MRKETRIATYPAGGVSLMEKFDLAQKYSRDTESVLKLVKLQMCMKYQQVNSRILHVVQQHAVETAKSAGLDRKHSAEHSKKLSASLDRKLSADSHREHHQILDSHRKQPVYHEWKLSADRDRKLNESLEAFVKQDQNFTRQSIEFRIKSQEKENGVIKVDTNGQALDGSNGGEQGGNEKEAGYLEVIEEEDEDQSEEKEEVLDEMLHGEVDQLLIDMPRINQFLPKIEPDGNTKKVQFSYNGRRPGAAAQGANPVYAKDIDVLVPNVSFETGHVIKTDDAVIKTKFKSEVSFETAYSGISTRKVIMEERNVYCGPYNVMVLCDQADPHRVVHTDGGRLIAVASKDRKVRFIDNVTGREHKRMAKGESKDDELPIITGHAGSVRCVHIIEEKGIVLSGSYDTSIRMWKISTGHCLKIFRGHRDTVLTIRVLGELMISGGKDNACKVWDMQTGKCMRTFRHRHPVTAVAMSNLICISGCEGGKVKVWNLKTGDLIKVLTGHHEAVTAVQFDRWHIVTGGRDGYALIWSAQGNHNRCLAALRHPKEVLCIEFTYLRCITGCGDGRIRIWNVITGQCCRIMRGNSRSDPILNILAIDDRITINTAVNLLVLNFEKVEWDYSLDEDKVPPLVQYGSYSDAPVRPQPYPYIRAQRMKKAGASNIKILNKEGTMEDQGRRLPMSQLAYRASQLPHSAKTLSARSLGSARVIQTQGEYDTASVDMREGIRSAGYVGKGSASRKSQTMSAGSKPPLPKSAKSRPLTSKSGASMHSVTIQDDVMEHEMIEDWREPLILQRRVSWAFEKPIVPKTKDISLSETKALLKSQMRAKAENIVPPDFIYLTVNQIQASMKPNETNVNTELNMQERRQIQIDTRHNRPSSSPGKIDPRTKVPVDQLDLSMFRDRHDDETLSEVSDWKSVKSLKSTRSKDSLPVTTEKEIYSTRCEVKHIRTAPKVSVHPRRIRSTVPRGRVIRPISATATRKDPPPTPPRVGRPVTAPAFRARPDTATSVPSHIAASMPGVQPPRKKVQGVGTTGEEVSMVPMLMYPPDMREKLANILKEKRLQRHEDQLESASELGVGKVSPFNDPMRSHVKFELRTHNQERDFIVEVEKQHLEKRQREEAVMERKKRIMWTTKARGGEGSRIQSAPAS